MKHLKKAEGYIDWNVMIISMKDEVNSLNKNYLKEANSKIKIHKVGSN